MKKLIRTIKYTTLAFAVLASSSACTNTDDGSASMDANPNNPELPVNVSYDCHIKPIIDANCVSCHNKYATYDKVKSDINHILGVITLPNNSGNVMPTTGRMVQYNIDIIAKWKQQGLTQNGNCNTSSGGSATVSYAADIKPLITATCLGCHGPSSNLPKPYNNYDQVKAAFTSITTVTNNNTMPVNAPWSAAQKTLFAKWKTDGYPQ